ncbi:hypothetical protein [Parahaliea mediterranea]|uniref:Uncharacterized protein n=1 Tax=Parahaliea mediterranea TaxID=651086 RepID=A0A939DIT8_9GAMM|nr:hypothetical protein [Parahaliea mediterranea]MBN7798626.1 hypothetical protein [Parahaliea mediterranea]
MYALRLSAYFAVIIGFYCHPAWSQIAPAIMTIAPDSASGHAFDDQAAGSSSAPRAINFSIFDNLSGGGASNLTITISVTSSNSAFVIDDSGCANIASMPSTAIPCSVTVAFSPTSPGLQSGDLDVTCTYVDIFPLGVLAPPPGALVGCRPDSTPLSSSFANYLAGTGTAADTDTVKAVPTIPLAGLAILAMALLLAGLGGAAHRRQSR